MHHYQQLTNTDAYLLRQYKTELLNLVKPLAMYVVRSFSPVQLLCLQSCLRQLKASLIIGKIRFVTPKLRNYLFSNQ